MTGKLAVQPDGRLTGPANIEYNEPFPCVNGSYGSGVMNGVVMHTTVGSYQGTVAVFNQPDWNASAFFVIGTDGTIHQFGPVGHGWMAWAQMEGNASWYSIEHVDNGNPDTPLTDAQLTASAQITECLSAFAHFPLQEANSPSERGYGVHSMGGKAWGAHTCPDLPPGHVRSLQRADILARAKVIRAGQPPVITEHITAGKYSLVQLCAEWGVRPAAVLRWTLGKSKGGLFASNLAGYLNAGDLNAVMPPGIALWHYPPPPLPSL